MRRASLWIGAAATMAACGPVDRDRVLSRSEVLIGSEVSCRGCSIVVEDVVALEDAYFAGPATLLHRDTTGRIYFVDPSDGLLKLYGRDGAFLRAIGRRGAGPGEYEVLRNVLVDRDNSIHVLDAQLGRYSRFDGDGVYQGSARTQIIAGFGKPAVLLVGGRLVVNDPPLVAERRYVLKVMDREGRTLHQFDEAPANARRDSWAMDRLLWPGSNGGLLVGKPFAFTVDVYDRDFRKTFSMRRSAEWIPVANSSEPPSDGLFDQRATAQLRGLWEDEAGLLWLLMILPSAVWTPGPSRDEGMQLAEEAIADLARRPRVETLIEVIDQETQRVVTRWKPDHNIGTPFSGGYFATPVLDSVGTPSLRITRLKLNRTEG